MDDYEDSEASEERPVKKVKPEVSKKGQKKWERYQSKIQRQKETRREKKIAKKSKHKQNVSENHCQAEADVVCSAVSGNTDDDTCSTMTMGRPLQEPSCGCNASGPENEASLQSDAGNSGDAGNSSDANISGDAGFTDVAGINSDAGISDHPAVSSRAPHVSKRDKVRETRDRLSQALVGGQRVAVDLGMTALMSAKEQSRLAQQLGRLYGSHRHAARPLHVYFTGLDKDSHLYKECVRKNCGFQSYAVEMCESSLLEVFKPQEIVYLSPDSPDVLEALHQEKVYVIGGLVDETVQKKITQTRAEDCQISSARLPIELYMEKCPDASKGSFSQILSVNQVFDILVTFSQTGDWKQALNIGVPKRKGFVIKQQSQTLS